MKNFLGFILLALFFRTTAFNNSTVKLKILAFITYSGQEPYDGSICEKAMQVAVDAVNSNGSMLPGYNIEPVFTNEGPLSFNVTAGLVRFAYFDKLNNTNSVKSPISLGSYFSPGCHRSGPVLHHINMIFIALGCGAPNLIGRRQRYPNVYRLRAPGSNIAIARAAFIKQFTSWKKIAHITYAYNIFDLGNANVFQSFIRHVGVKSVWYEPVGTVDDATIKSLKESNLRIIVNDIGSLDLAVQFFCKTYKFGIRGSRYTFISSANAFADPKRNLSSVLPQWCTKTMLIEQYKITIWLGGYIVPDANYGKTDLGYDLDEFEERLDELTSGSRVAGYRSRFYCHDDMMQVLFALDKTEKKLQAMNMSLRDYQNNPQLVMNIANKSATETDYISLRVGRAVYSKRLEMDYEPFYVGYFDEANVFIRTVYKVALRLNESIISANGYNFEKRLLIAWPGSFDGKFPRDFWEEQNEILDVRIELQILICIVSGIALIGHAKLFFTILFGRSLPILTKMKSKEALILLGSGLLDLSAIAFIVTFRFLNAMCVVRMSLLVAGISVIHGTINGTTADPKYATGNNNPKYRNTMTRGLRWVQGSGDVLTVGTTQSVDSTLQPFINNSIVSRCTIFVFANAIILLSWLSASHNEHSLIKVAMGNRYDDASDIMFHQFGYICPAFTQVEWLLAFVAFHFIVLVHSGHKCYRLRNTCVGLVRSEITRFGLLCVKSGTLMVACTIILLAFRDPYAKNVVIAISALVFSGVTTGLILYTSLSCRNLGSIQMSR